MFVLCVVLASFGSRRDIIDGINIMSFTINQTLKTSVIFFLLFINMEVSFWRIGDAS
jgi:hypothetical protein